jgi:hypothetical protein
MVTNQKYKAYLIIFLLALCFSNSAYSGDFTCRRTLSGITGTWHTITIPNEMFGRLNTDLSDLRILGITNAHDTLQVPYLLNLQTEIKTTTPVPFKALNQTHNSKGYYYTFDVGTQPINLLTLDFAQQNFDWQTELSGSNNQQEWFTIADNCRMVSIQNQLTNYHFTTLLFATTSYRYYRVCVRSNTNPQFLRATISLQTTKPGVFNTYQPSGIKTTTDKNLKQTFIDIQLPQAVPVSYLHIKSNTSTDYYRPIQIQYLSDSTKTATGWQYYYTNIAPGILSSLEEPAFTFNNTLVKNLRVVIDNRDNPALSIDTITVKGNVYSVTARFTQAADYFLYYGNPPATMPDYDLANFKDKIPAQLSALTVGPEQTIATAKPASGGKPLFENKIWLWIIMALIILLLGWFSVKMISNKQ